MTTDECRSWPIAPMRLVGEPEEDYNQRHFAFRMRVLTDPQFEWMLSDKPTTIVVGYDEFGKPTGATRAIKEP